MKLVMRIVRYTLPWLGTFNAAIGIVNLSHGRVALGAMNLAVAAWAIVVAVFNAGEQ